MRWNTKMLVISLLILAFCIIVEGGLFKMYKNTTYNTKLAPVLVSTMGDAMLCSQQCKSGEWCNVAVYTQKSVRIIVYFAYSYFPCLKLPYFPKGAHGLNTCPDLMFEHLLSELLSNSDA